MELCGLGVRHGRLALAAGDARLLCQWLCHCERSILASVEQTKYLLDESELPQRWYNIRADMPSPPQPVLHPGTGAAGRA